MVINRILYKQKPRKISRKGIVVKLDHIVSLIVRARDKTCVLCNSSNQLTAGHIFSRKAYSTRWDLENVWCQCWGCNFKHTFDAWPYFEWFIKKFGQDKFDQLRVKFKSVRQYKTFELVELYQELELFYKDLQ